MTDFPSKTYRNVLSEKLRPMTRALPMTNEKPERSRIYYFLIFKYLRKELQTKSIWHQKRKNMTFVENDNHFNLYFASINKQSILNLLRGI